MNFNLRLLTLVLMLFSVSQGFAQLVTPFTTRFQANEKGSIVYLSNGSTTCSGGCASVQNQVPPNGTGQNNNQSNAYIDIDGDPATFMSSSDSLTLQPCSEILFAGLYWGGIVNTTNAIPNYAVRDQVRLKVDNGSYIDLTADEIQNNTVGYTTYHCYKDITSIVAANGNARYTLANVVTQTGAINLSGGWSIVVVYKNSLLDMRNLTVFEGLAVVRTGVGATDLPISGFLTPLSGPVTFEVGAIAFDGDRGQTGDQLLFNGAGSFVQISDALNPATDIFNSTISNSGVLTPFRTPGYNNMLGYDADIFRPDNSTKNFIGNSATNATVRITTSSETVLLKVVTTAIDVYEPDVRMANVVQDLNGGSVQQGDTLEYTVTTKNIGSDIAINAIVSDTVYFNVDYVPNSFRITYGPNSGPKTDGSGDDQAEYDPISRRVIVRIGTGANSTAGGSILNDFVGTDSTVFKFRVTATTDCGKILCDNVVRSQAFVSYTGQISGNDLSSASNPNIYDMNGCPVDGSTLTTIDVGGCTFPPDTAVFSLCEDAFTNVFPRPFYQFFNSGFTPVTQLSTSGTYYAIRNIGNGTCMDTVVITAVVTPCADDDGDGVFNPYDTDDDNDGVPDYTELCGPAATDFTCAGGDPDEDTDEDGIPNYLDPDFCALNMHGVCANMDTDGDGTIETQDLDSDNDGISDVIESGGPDPDNDGIIGTGTPTDTDGDGWSDITDPSNGGTPLTNLDTDGDGVPNTQDLDSDNDGMTDIVENGTDALDGNGDGQADGTDTDGDGVINVPGLDNNNGFGGSFPAGEDSDNDGNLNSLDLDSDNDGITDVRENGGTDANNDGMADGADADGDGVPASADTQNGFGAEGDPVLDSDSDGIGNANDIDSDDDGIVDNIEAQSTAGYIAPSGSDADNDGLDDAYDTTPGFGGNGTVPVNTDGTDQPDYLDLNSDNDGIPDAVEGFDTDGSNVIDGSENDPAGTDIDTDGLDDGYDNNTASPDPTNGQVPADFPQNDGGPDRDWRQQNNVPPSVLNDTLIATEDTPISVTAANGILDGDSDIDGTTLTVNVTPVSGPAHGSVSLNADGSYTYTPAPNYFGPDTFVVAVCDNGIPLPPSCVNDTVFVTVNPVNDGPLVNGESYNGGENTTLTVPAGTGIISNDTDGGGENSPLTVNTIPVSGPDHGNATINTDGSFTYIPDPGFNGTDTIVVTVCDTGIPLPAICANDTIVITIAPFNDSPVTVNESILVTEDTPFTATAGTGILSNGDNDPDGTPLTVNTTPVIAPSNGNVTVNADGSYTYTPNADYSGNDFFVVSVCDNGIPLPASCTNDTVFITVNPVNDGPVITDEAYNTGENVTLTVPAVTGITSNDTDGGGENTPLTVSTTPVSGPSNGNVTVNADGSFTYVPDPGFNGLDTIVVSVCDNGIPLPAVCANDTIVITVAPFNDAPVTVNETINVTEDTPFTATAGTGILSNGDNDPDGTPLTVNITPVVAPSNGSVTVNTDGSYTYTPGPDYFGTDTFVVSVCDNGIPLPALCTNDTVFITVNPVNDAPVVTNDTAVVAEDGTLTVTSGNGLLSNGDGDIDGTLTATTTPVSGPSNGTIVVGADGSYTFTPDPDFFGTDTVVVQVCDNGNPLPAICFNDTLFITVTPVNDPPVTVNETYTVNEDDTLITTVLDGILSNGDADGGSEGGPLTVTVTVVDSTSNGSVTVNTDGTFTYIPNPDYFGTDTFVVAVCDQGIPLPAACTNDTIVLVINPVNDAPVATDDTSSTAAGSGGVTIDVQDNDNDTENDNLTTSIVGNPPNGTVTIVNGDSILYVPDPNFCGTDTFYYQVCDNGTPVLCDTAMVIVNVFPTDADGDGLSDLYETLTADTDNDGVPDYRDIDSDNDGLTDAEEAEGSLGCGTPLVQDTDGDGVPDHHDLDSDNDGLTDIVESGMGEADQDNDGVADTFPGWDANGDGIADAIEGFDPQDADGDGVEDQEDLDADNDGISDVVEGGHGNSDTNNDGVIDGNDTNGNDTDGDGIPDAVDGSSSFGDGPGGQDENEQDNDGDGVIDSEDLDADNDGIADVIEGGFGHLDTDNDGVVDGTDTDGDGIINLPEIDNNSSFNGTPGSQDESTQDADGDGSIDSEDLDADNDGIADVIEGGFGDLDTDNDGVVDGEDTDGDGIINVGPIDTNDGFGGDPGSQDESTQDYDGDGDLDSEDTDADNDGIPDIIEGGNGDLDTDNDGMIDDPTDTDNDGLADPIDDTADYGGGDGSQDEAGMDPDGDGNINSEDLDSNGNGVDDETEGLADCDNDQVPDFIDMDIDCDTFFIPSGFSPDGDGKNDTFVIPGIQDYPGNRLQIFNRWGNLLFEAENYQNDWAGFANAGLYVGQGRVPQGTYYYILDLNNGTKGSTGFIVIKY